MYLSKQVCLDIKNKTNKQKNNNAWDVFLAIQKCLLKSREWIAKEEHRRGRNLTNATGR